MDKRPIRTDDEHAAALRRIDVLMDAAGGTPEEDELLELVALVEAYEDEHFPIGAPEQDERA